MYARRFLGCVFVTTLLVVAGAFAIYQWGGQVLVEQAVPRGHFEARAAGSGPDYTHPDAWIARPDIRGNPSEWLPSRIAFGMVPEWTPIFYIHPTTYLATDRWNAPLISGEPTETRTRLFVQSQSSALTSAGLVWAPRYRQAAYGAFLLNSPDAAQALDFAYRDVAAAFDQFLREVGERPIILAGHSQGALHLERLLREKIAGKPLAKRVVAAYVVGWPISTSADLPALGLPPCSAPMQTGCILSWMTFRDPPNPDFIFRQWEKTKGYSGGERRQEDTLCVNPISGVQDGSAQAEDNPGTLIPTPDMRDATLRGGVVGAHCEKGLLILDGTAPQLGAFVLPGNNYHVYDYALFWGAIRRDAERRLRAWRR
jgi:hypothetical protein